MPQQGKKPTRAEHEAREALLIDRLAITLMLLKQRYGNDWSPWFGENMWESDDGMGEILRKSEDYPMAVDVVKLFIHRSERNELGKN